ncbi:hypothetical protein BY996DRAFT_7109500, partial [Phakopsora pachyrhizi]
MYVYYLHTKFKTFWVFYQLLFFYFFCCSPSLKYPDMSKYVEITVIHIDSMYACFSQFASNRINLRIFCLNLTLTLTYLFGDFICLNPVWTEILSS